MRDRFVFEDGVDLSAYSSTGAVSTNIWDLDNNIAAGSGPFGQLKGWLNIHILTGAGAQGCTSGFYIELRNDDQVALNLASGAGVNATEQTLLVVFLKQSQLVAGARFSFGIETEDLMGKYVGCWLKAHTQSVAAALSMDISWEEHPIARLGLQRKNTSTGA